MVKKVRGADVGRLPDFIQDFEFCSKCSWKSTLIEK